MITLPKHGMPRDDLLTRMRAMQGGDADWRAGRTFSLVYHAGDDVIEVLKDAARLYFMENALSPLAFPSLRRMETEVLSIAASLLHGGPEAAGSMTSGGTESILMAVKTARDRARAQRPEISLPEMILPVSAHPAFEKAAHYLGVRPVRIPVRDDFRADLEAAHRALTPNTILLVASAPGYPHGVVDPIPELAALAAEREISCHVDACLGGFLLPFLEKLGHPVPPFDFRVPGVTSISADLHKYGFAARGASTILYRDREIRRHQFIAFPDWPGGLYGSPTMAGSRPGGPIAAAWAVFHYLGEEGYLRLARSTLEATRALLSGIRAIPGLQVLGEPDMSVFAFGSEVLDVYALGDAMEARGWHLDRQQMPPALHVMVSPMHLRIVDPFLADLEDCARAVRHAGPAAQGQAAMYGMLGAIPDRGVVGSFILDFLDGLDRVA
jgi:glutamate/tyrosine decarboxylase-like PLP-dependent enzyme